MKKLLLVLILLNVSIVSKSQDISLAGDELLKYQKKQSTSLAAVIIGTGISVLGATQEEGKPLIYIGGMIATVGVTINISSLGNLKRSANNLIGRRD